MNVPYIGITDFTNFDQVKRMLSVFKKHSQRGLNRKLHVGVMMSYKTLHGIETQFSKVFPPKETIASIFASDETYNCLHYADYRGHPELWKSLLHAIQYGGMGIDALQLDITWPDPGEVANAVHASRKNLEVILQVGNKAFEEAGDDPDAVVERLRDYEGVICRVLLDRSAGRGIGMDAVGLIPYARAIRNAFPDLGIVAAGGLGPESVDLVRPLVLEFLDLSIDAQGKLRPSGDILDPVDWNFAERYLIRALDMFRLVTKIMH